MALTTPSQSPAIVTKEIDLTGGVPNVPTSTGAFVGEFLCVFFGNFFFTQVGVAGFLCGRS